MSRLWCRISELVRGTDLRCRTLPLAGVEILRLLFDFCGVEIDRDTGMVDKYVTLHDAGRVLNPALVDGQVRGGFAMAVGAALYEQLAYAEDGGFISASPAAFWIMPCRPPR